MLTINLHFNNRRINLLIYCYIMGKISNLKKRALTTRRKLAAQLHQFPDKFRLRYESKFRKGPNSHLQNCF